MENQATYIDPRYHRHSVPVTIEQVKEGTKYIIDLYEPPKIAGEDPDNPESIGGFDRGTVEITIPNYSMKTIKPV